MPLTFDMPLEKLYSYPGISPRPQDFDAYWERALAELDAIDPMVELAPAKYQVPAAECLDLYFTGVGGARVHAKYLRPRQIEQPGPALLKFHGYSGSSGTWFDKLPFAAHGFSVAALDCRGQGGISEDVGRVSGWTLRGHIIRGLDDRDPEKLLFRQIFLDTVQLARIVMAMPEVDPERVGAFGTSQGGGLTLACAALEPRIRALAPTSPFLCDYKRVWEIDLAQNSYSELSEYFRKFDPRHEREVEIFDRLGYIDVQHLSPRIQGEVLLAIGLMDKICPPSTQFAAYNKISSPKKLVLYPDYAHEDLLGHDDIVLQFMLNSLSFSTS